MFGSDEGTKLRSSGAAEFRCYDVRSFAISEIAKFRLYEVSKFGTSQLPHLPSSDAPELRCSAVWTPDAAEFGECVVAKFGGA